MKKIILITIAILWAVQGFSQLDITKRNVTLDTLKGRTLDRINIIDTIYYLGSKLVIQTNPDTTKTPVLGHYATQYDISLKQNKLTGNGVVSGFGGSISYRNDLADTNYVLNKTKKVQLDTTYTHTTQSKGLFYWDATNGTAAIDLLAGGGVNNVSLQMGQENHIYTVNKTGSIVPNGTTVYINGSQGNRPTIAKAGAMNGHGIDGITTHDFAINQTGYTTSFGTISPLNTSAYDEGDSLYMSKWTGHLTDTVYDSPYLVQYVGRVTNAHLTQGKIFVNIKSALSADTTMSEEFKTIAPTQKAVKRFVKKAINDTLTKAIVNIPNRMKIGNEVILKTTDTDLTPDALLTLDNDTVKETALQDYDSLYIGYSKTSYNTTPKYILTATSAPIKMTDTVMVILDKPGTYMLFATAGCKYVGASYASIDSMTFKLRRTNNTASDITNATAYVNIPVMTTLTDWAGAIPFPVIVYTTANSNDRIQMWGQVANLPSAGYVRVNQASLVAIKIKD